MKTKYSSKRILKMVVSISILIKILTLSAFILVIYLRECLSSMVGSLAAITGAIASLAIIHSSNSGED